MKKLLLLLSLASCIIINADAKGGASSGGGRGGGSSVSAPARPAPAPSVAPRPSTPPAASPAQRPSPAPTAAPKTTTTTTTTTRSVNTSSRYVSGGGVAYGGMGMGYGYSNGLLTGMIIGNMMHPHNTVVYAGGGAHSNNALLYPDGRVVNQQGQQVGTYQNGQFTETPNGPVVAQPIPQDALHPPAEREKTVSEWMKDILLFTLLILVIVTLIIFLRGLFL